MFDLILLPLNSSPESERALQMALNLAGKYNSKLLLLSVVDLPDDLPERESHLAQVRERAQTLAQKVRERLQTEGFVSQARIEEGKTAFVICDVADETGTGLIVMGSRGLGLTEEGKQHSTSDRVINLAPCPVLVVP
ncbi:universal stress protein [Gloeobacter kilaueensis]|uniref:UspA domain-containing protein n=1 Tax=Gloeobacter kilaueensis (strain ATCC BAA-2537 / CCAP 1431/1 / ULC 316 / JS1) TaxID=1183438 RepID=U5QIY8_GLOK1|nr:universal stress protein [Gloeobacter kilaueensis]AGY58818.1 UspA domain-containing protein [Gloeobacter kilaueensis JS1]